MKSVLGLCVVAERFCEIRIAQRLLRVILNMRKIKFLIIGAGLTCFFGFSAPADDAPSPSARPAAEVPAADAGAVEEKLAGDDLRVREEFIQSEESRLKEIEERLAQNIDQFNKEKEKWLADQDKEVAAEVDRLFETKQQTLNEDAKKLEALKKEIEAKQSGPGPDKTDGKKQNPEEAKTAAGKSEAASDGRALKELQDKISALEQQRDGWRGEIKKISAQLTQKSEAVRRLEETLAGLKSAPKPLKAEPAAPVPAQTGDQDKIEKERRSLRDEQARLDEEKKGWEAQKQKEMEDLRQLRAMLEEKNELRKSGDETPSPAKDSKEAAPAAGDAEQSDADAQAALEAKTRELEKKKGVLRTLLKQKMDELDKEKEFFLKEKEAFQKERQAWRDGKEKPQTPETAQNGSGRVEGSETRTAAPRQRELDSNQASGDKS